LIGSHQLGLSQQDPLQQTWPEPQSAFVVQGIVFTLSARAMFATPRQAKAMPARPRPNFFNAPRRVTDWARLLVSSSNLLFILPFRFVVWFWFVVVLCALPSNGQPARNPLASPTF